MNKAPKKTREVWQPSRSFDSDIRGGEKAAKKDRRRIAACAKIVADWLEESGFLK